MSDATHEVRTDEAEHRDDETESGDEEAADEEIDDEETDDEYDHLDSVEDGSGCTEIWEHLSEQRDDD